MRLHYLKLNIFLSELIHTKTNIYKTIRNALRFNIHIMPGPNGCNMWCNLPWNIRKRCGRYWEFLWDQYETNGSTRSLVRIFISSAQQPYQVYMLSYQFENAIWAIKNRINPMINATKNFHYSKRWCIFVLFLARISHSQFIRYSSAYSSAVGSALECGSSGLRFKSRYRNEFFCVGIKSTFFSVG